MKLADFFATIGPFLEGRVTHAQAAQALYGGDPANAADARRLQVYGRFCRIHRFEAVDSVYSATRAAVIAAGGPAAWEPLVEDYFRAFPMHHVELNENGDRFPEHVAAGAAARGLAAWVPELADLEWWEWRAKTGADDPADLLPDQGPLRVAASVDLRPYAHDLVGWLDGAERAPAPEARRTVVLFWRDRELDGRREEATPLEMAVLRAVLAGQDPRAPGAVAGADPGELAGTVDDLVQAGVLLGAA